MSSKSAKYSSDAIEMFRITAKTDIQGLTLKMRWVCFSSPLGL